MTSGEDAGGGRAPSRHWGRPPPPLLGDSSGASLQPPGTALQSQRGTAGVFAPHFPETIQTGSELGGLPTSGPVGGLHSPGVGDGAWGWGAGDQSQTHLPQSGTPTHPGPPPTNPSSTWGSWSCPCLSPPHLEVPPRPPEAPREQLCLCVQARGLPALPRDGWAAGGLPPPVGRPLPTQPPGTRDPGQ